MIASGQLFPVIKASGTILDPEIALESTAFRDEPRVLERDTRLDLFDGQVVLLFAGSKFILLNYPEPKDRFPYYQLLYFIIYRSRLNYNIVIPERLSLDPTALPSSTAVTFLLKRLVEMTRYETEDCQISIEVQELEDFLQICTPYLYFAIAYYLIGCENHRYFLIEFFKAVEVIENAFGGESLAINALRKYGVVRSDFKKLKRYANEQQRPFDIGRHAPKGKDLRVIDIKLLLDEPLSDKIFCESVAVTRQAIDAYFAYLCDREKPKS